MKPLFLSTPLAVLGLLICALPSFAFADNKVAIGFQAGTFGMGPEVSYSVTDQLNVRGAISKYNFKKDDLDLDDVKYDAKLDWGGLAGFVDFHPFRGSFRLTAGLIKSNSKITGNAQVTGVDPNKTFEIGDTTYYAGDFNSLGVKIDFKSMAPYFGIGWGYHTQEPGFGLAFDLGVILQGSPNVKFDYAASSLLTNNGDAEALLSENIAKEEKSLEDDAAGFDKLPFISLGINYAFSF